MSNRTPLQRPLSLALSLVVLLATTPLFAQEVLWEDDFESYGTQANPPGWFDSAPGNPENEAPGLYKTWPDPLDGINTVFGKKSASESFTHYRDLTFLAVDGFRLDGRMLRTKTKAHMGVTILSSFPSPDAYYLLAQATDGGSVELVANGTGPLDGDLDSGVAMDEDTWYRFAVLVTESGDDLSILAKVWEDGTPEPDSWSIDALDSGAHLDSGWLGLWGERPGHKYWDDLVVTPADVDPPVISITESGAPLTDGSLFNRTVVPVVEVEDASEVMVDITLDGVPFTSGSPVEVEGDHQLAVEAVDVFGNAASAVVTFTIDLTPPEFVVVSPPDGTVTVASEVTLSGQVAGASTVAIDGATVTFDGSNFSGGPYSLGEGERTFLLTAVDAAGNAAQLVHRIVRDSTPPAIDIRQPTPGSVVGSSPITVAGIASDPHLSQVTVAGAEASVSGTSFSAPGIPLQDGPNAITVTATDVVGNSAQADVEVFLDTNAPSITVTDAGAPLADGSLFNRAVVPTIEVDDATETTVEVTLDGDPFSSGTPVEEEGQHLLSVTATDEAGNSTSVEIGFEIDLTPPEFGTIEPPDGSLLGDAEVILTGSVTGATGIEVDGAPAALTGDSFSAGPLSLAEGENVFTLVATDDASNSTQRLHRLIRDATPPELVVTQPADGATVATEPIVVSGTASDENLTAVVVNGQTASLSGDAFSAENVSLLEGSNAIAVEASDEVGNSTVVELTVILDTEPPLISVTENGSDLVDGAQFDRAVTPLVEVTDATDTTTEITLDGAPFGSGSTVSSDGDHLLAITATDAAGNESALSIGFTIDQTPPVFLEVSPPAGTVTAEFSITLVGRVAGAEEVTVDGEQAVLVGEEFTAGPFPLGEGERLFTLVASDAIGNSTNREHRIVRDSTPPVLSISQPYTDAVVGTTAVTVRGEVSDPHLDTVTVNGVTASVSGGTWLAPAVPVVEGANELRARGTDEAGNLAETTRSVVRDTEPPALSVTDPAQGTVIPDTEIVVRGVASDPHLDRVEVNGETAALTGETWSITVPLDEGDNTVEATATDELGNRASATVLVHRDSTAPEVEITSPAEGARLAAESVEVTGTIEDEEGVTLTVNGVAADVAGGQFTAADVPLDVEGEVRIIARARDAQGNEGVHTRTVIRDTVPPELVSSDPPEGALAIPLNDSFRLTFSEEMAESPPSDAVTLGLSGGGGLPVQVQVAADEIVVDPQAPLPSAAELVLTLTPQLEDLAGNALTDPRSLTFTSADGAAPPAPTVDPVPPAALCAGSLTLSGTSEAGAAVAVTGGAALASTRAASDGNFSLSVSLVPEVLNRLRLTATDRSGNRSLATEITVRSDCTAPSVTGSSHPDQTFVVTFSEAVDPVTVDGAIGLSVGGSPVEVSVTVDGDRTAVSVTAQSALPDEPIRLSVTTAVSDLAGNPLAYPYSRVFGAVAEESFIVGSVIDDAIGRPLPGARIVVHATDGVPLAEPLPEQTTGDDGEFLIPVAVGTHDVLVTRPGYTPVFRTVTTTAGQGTNLFDPRPTPTLPGSETGSDGGLFEAGAVSLTVPAGALEAVTEVSVTALTEQGLPALLPYGWSPRGAVWIDLGDIDVLDSSATLSFPVEAPDGAVLPFVALELDTLQWRVVTLATVTNGVVSVPVLVGGAYVVVDPDEGTLAPPPAVEGEILGSSVHPTGQEVTSAALTFDPSVVLPGQTSVGTVTYELAEPVASGMPLTLVISEELHLLDASVRRQAPYEADLALYRTSGGEPRSRFRLRPSEAARLLPLDFGSEEVSVTYYGSETVRGNVVGPGGGTVTNDDGDQIEIGVGALAEPTAVVLTRRPVGDLPLELPTGLELAGLVEVDLGDRELAVPATLRFAADAPPADAAGLLFDVVDLGDGESVLRPVAALDPTPAGWATAPIDPDDLPWPGLREEGLYLFARLLTDLGYVRGTVFDVGGQALGDALVWSESVAWIQLSGGDGSYVLPLPLGGAQITAENALTGNAGTAAATVTAAGERLDLDLHLVIVGPTVVETTPVAGAVDVPSGVNPTVRFSEPVARSSLADGIRLVDAGGDGSPVGVTLDHQGSLVTLVPDASLLPGESYELRISTTVRDLQGYPLAAPVSVEFTTLDVLLPDDVDLAKVFLVEPDAAGEAHVVGEAGAVPADTLVFAENITALSEVESVAADQDGGFELAIPASLTDRILLHVLVEGGNEIVVELTPFLTADRRTAFVDERATIFTTADGITVRVDEGTFEGPVEVTVTAQPIADPPVVPSVERPADLTALHAFTVDFGGAEAARPLHFRLPAPDGAAAGDYWLTRLVDVLGERRWMLHDLARLDGDTLTTEPLESEVAGLHAGRQVDPLDVAPPEAAGLRLSRVSAATRDADRASRSLQDLTSAVSPTLARRAAEHPKEFVPGAGFPGHYELWYPEIDMGYVAAPFVRGWSMAIFNETNGMVAAINAAVWNLLAHDAVLIPTRLDVPVSITVRDLDTGYRLFEGEFGAPPSGEVVELPIDDFGDSTAPYPVSGSPLRFFVIETGAGASGDLDRGISFEMVSGVLTVTGGHESTDPDTQIRLVGLDGDAAVKTRSAGDGSEAPGSFTLPTPAPAGDRYLLAIGGTVASDAPLRVEFSEAIDPSFVGLDVENESGVSVVPEISAEGTFESVVVRPRPGWVAGATYTLVLAPELADGSGNAWGETLRLEFDVAESEVVGEFAGLADARDMARLGSWLFVAADVQGLGVLDISDPSAITNVFGAGGQTFLFQLQDPVRGVAVDRHGRVFYTGGGVSADGVLQALDPLDIVPGDRDGSGAALRGATRISDRLGADPGTVLPEGLPRRLTVLTDDEVFEWRAGEPPPPGLVVTPAEPPDLVAPYTVSVSGSDPGWASSEGLPVTLRNLDRGRWSRVGAAADGSFSLQLEVVAGDRLALLRNRSTVAYVAIIGAGVAVVDADPLWRDEAGPESTVLSYYTGFGEGLSLCDEPVSDIGTATIDLDGLFESEADPQITIAALVEFKGLLLLASDPSDVGQVSKVADFCAEIDGSRRVGGLVIVEDYRFDTDADGSLADESSRDYAVIAHRAAGVLVVDVTDRANPTLVGKVKVSGSAAHVSVDRRRRKLYVAAHDRIFVVDFDTVPTVVPQDSDGDGRDDRVLEEIEIPGTNHTSPLLVLPELGLAYAGALDGGVRSIGVATPQVSALALSGSAGATGLGEPVFELAPFGVPTRALSEQAEAPDLPGAVRLVAALPGAAGETVKLDVESLGPGGVPIDGVSGSDDLPPTALTGADGVILRRQADSALEDGYHLYVSEKAIATVADLRAVFDYQRTADEDDECIRCDQGTAGLTEDDHELLSGDTVAVRFPSDVPDELAAIYAPLWRRQAALELASTRWELSPALRQEPTLNPSTGGGDVVPGTLLHSGEMSHTVTDLFVRGRGFDFAFTRTYRSQTLGSGPLGPGWDHGYRQRLRELPDGDVEYFDGRGRRELFERVDGGAGDGAGEPSYEAPAGRFVELSRTTAGWVLLDAQRNRLRFDRFGRLVAMADAVKDSEETGNVMRFSYDLASRLVRIEDSLERSYFLSYDDDGRLVELSDFTGRTVSYDYDGDGRLVSVTSPAVTVGESSFADGLSTEYGYDQSIGGELAAELNRRDNLVSITDARGQRWLELDYSDEDGDGRSEEVTSQTWGGHSLSIAYGFGDGGTETTVTDRRGDASTYTHDGAGQLTRLEDPLAAVWTYRYDDEGLLTKSTPPLGPVTEHVYDTGGDRRSRGNLVETRLSAGSGGPNGSSATLLTSIEYHARTNLPVRVVDPRGSTTVIERDQAGLPTRVTRAAGAPEASTTLTSYNDFGQPVEVTNPNGHLTRYEYFATGDSEGYLSRVVTDADGLGLTTRYETEGRGNVTAVIDPRGVRSETVYNELDWVVETRQAATGSSDGTPALGYVTTYRYDENGNRIEVREPFGDDGGQQTATTTTYGLLDEVLSVARETAPGGPTVTTTYAYDESFNRTRVVDPEGNLTRTDYDARDLVESVTRGAGTAEAATDTYGYDAEGRRVSYVDDRGHQTLSRYDGYGRVRESVDQLGNATRIAYDDGGNAVSTERYDAAGALLARSSSGYDLLERRTSSIRHLLETAEQAITRTAYDPAGNVLSTTDALGRTTSFTYDGAERLVSTTDPIGNRVEQTLNAAGQPVATTLVEQLPAGGTVSTTTGATYDALGRRRTLTDALGNTTETVYDARGNVRFAIDPEGHFTESTYDGLDRLVSTVRPEGIAVDYGYDDASRLTSYTDALGNTTSWDYDALGHKTRTTYPDGTTESYAYDGVGNVTSITDANGTVIQQGFDAANRLTSRLITPAAGVEGPTAEAYSYDGLDRLTQASSGATTTTLSHDSLSRLSSESTAGPSASGTVSYDHDLVGNVVSIEYPSGETVSITPDALNRPSSISAGGTATASYGYRGRDLLATRTLGNGLTSQMGFDAARRMTSQLATSASGGSVFAEELSWSPRDLKVASSRTDQNSRGLVVGYDGAGRAVDVVRRADPIAAAPNNSTPGPGVFAGLPERHGFTYDTAENLLSRTEVTADVAETASLPLDGSGRNRPGSVDGTALSWDANGNLTGKGDLTYHYDYRNRLTRVTDGGAEVASYGYDAFNRRIARTAGGEGETVVWGGWQALETYAGDQLESRRLFGAGLDEIVRQEVDVTGDGVLDTISYPLYDETGNLAVMTDASGQPTEKYDYTPYGERTITVDATPPEIEQVRVVAGEVWLELSEAVNGETVSDAIVDSELTLTETGSGTPLELTSLQPVTEGRQAGQRVVLSTDTAPAAGTEVELLIPAGALFDEFLNSPSTDYVATFPWPSGDAVIEDTVAPRVEQVIVREQRLEIELSEEPDLAAAAAAIDVPGQTLTWSLSADRYTLISNETLPVGAHTIEISTGALDLVGLGLDEAFSTSLAVDAQDRIAHEAPDPDQTSGSAIGNSHGFHGRDHDPATGLVYFRNRWLDPELGRFITTDPLGYVDAPSMYQAFGNSPLFFNDPSGLALYAFDGTWKYKELTGAATNVWKMREASLDPNTRYYGGIGNKVEYGWFKRWFCGAFGCGGNEILQRAFGDLLINYNDLNDHVIDIVGFSRGASLALEFANMVADGIPKTDASGNPTGKMWSGTEIRFVGLFDTVGSFGVRGRNKHRKYRLRLPTEIPIGRAVHAVALNETRKRFQVVDLLTAEEVGFVGTHFQIGAGGKTLAWMLEQAREAGLEFDDRYDESPISATMCPADNDRWYFTNGARDLPDGLIIDSPEDLQRTQRVCGPTDENSKYWPRLPVN